MKAWGGRGAQARARGADPKISGKTRTHAPRGLVCRAGAGRELDRPSCPSSPHGEGATAAMFRPCPAARSRALRATDPSGRPGFTLPEPDFQTSPLSASSFDTLRMRRTGRGRRASRRLTSRGLGAPRTLPTSDARGIMQEAEDRSDCRVPLRHAASRRAASPCRFAGRGRMSQAAVIPGEAQAKTRDPWVDSRDAETWIPDRAVARPG
jgi:hypothetical protein